MTLTIALQADALENLEFRKDSSLHLAAEAQNRGHSVYHYTPQALRLENGQVLAQARPVTLKGAPDYSVTAGAECVLDLSGCDVVLMRQNPPFDLDYLTVTWMLERVADSVFIVNDPRAVRDWPSKFFPMEFPEFVPPTLVASDFRTLEDFMTRWPDVILKPLHAFAGGGITRLRADRDAGTALLEKFQAFRRDFPGPFMVQKFIPEAALGDKRIILFDGVPEAAILRIPADADSPANITRGARVEAAALTPREEALCALLGPRLQKAGIFFAGLDMIGGYITEINIVSPGTLVPANAAHAIRLEARFWDRLEPAVAARKKQAAAGKGSR